jgi:hypothetical protein
LFVAARAEASCGDYLMLKGQHENGSPAPNATTDDSSKSQTPRSPTPCHGPFCSGSHQLPPLAPLAPAPVSADEWGFVYSDAVPACSGQDIFLALDDFGHPIRHGSSIYHPPR